LLPVVEKEESMKKQILFVLILCFGILSLGAQTRGDAYEPNDSASAAYPLNLGSFNLAFSPGDEDWFTFRLNAPQMIRIQTESSLDTKLNLYGPNSSSSEISSNDDGGEDLNARIIMYLDQIGTYYVQVTPYDSETSGPYVLVLETVTMNPDSMEPNNSRAQAKPLNISRLPLDLSLFPNGDYDWFRLDLGSFQYRDGEVLSLYTSGDIDTYMQLYQGDTFLLEDDDGAGNGNNARIIFLPDRKVSDYYLNIRGYNNDSVGEYTLHGETSIEEFDQYEPNNTRAQARTLSISRLPLDLSLLPNGDYDWFRLDLGSFRYRDGEVLSLYTSGGIDTYMELYQGDTLLFENDDGAGNGNNARIMFLPDRRVSDYYLNIRGYNNDSVGEYTLHSETSIEEFDQYEPNNSRAQARTLSISQLPLELSLLPNGDYDWFRLDLGSFQYRDGEVLSLYTSGDIDTYMELYQGDTLLFENDDGAGNGNNARIMFTPDRRVSDYYLNIRGYNNDTVGGYTLHSETNIEEFDQYEPNNTRAQATRISVAQTLSGNALASYDAVDWFSFSITQPGTYAIGTTGGMDTVITLYDNNNGEIGSDDDGGRDQNALIESYFERGTYYAKVTQYGDEYGEYSFYVRQR
jgi:hypothetical protein